MNSDTGLAGDSREGMVSSRKCLDDRQFTSKWTLNRWMGILIAGHLLALLDPVDAQNATWDTNPGSNAWGATTNWTPHTVPTGTATFGSSNTTSIVVSSHEPIGGIQFNAGAPAYSFDISSGASLNFNGSGIVNNSSNAPTFLVSGNVGLQFSGTSTAGNANITVNNGAAMTFTQGSMAGNANITVNGGQTVFSNTNPAGNASITVNAGGLTRFTSTSKAGNATITTNNGGNTRFQLGSSGDNARFITNAGGTLDISALSSAGMTAGSIEGAGLYSLGSKLLTVGSNNLSTTVSGIITDGGSSGGTGGSLVKVGTGGLVLSGTNTYTGGTMISAGILQLGSGGASGSILGNVVDNSLFAINRSDVFTFGGVISGTGLFQQLGSGTIILTATNSYGGGTT
ncbi:MAG: autotransporter-associated beta strand repeat-containing protein, partial [Verrucomicrobia bacterium]|nr:autotransporter-associated beta strand repeat-containing protein [Verrucomicrobiota bacterium]